MPAGDRTVRYVVQVAELWKDWQTEWPFSVTVGSGKMSGFMPVYDTREEAEADYPYIEIEEVVFREVPKEVGNDSD